MNRIKNNWVIGGIVIAIITVIYMIWDKRNTIKGGKKGYSFKDFKKYMIKRELKELELQYNHYLEILDESYDANSTTAFSEYKGYPKWLSEWMIEKRKQGYSSKDALRRIYNFIKSNTDFDSIILKSKKYPGVYMDYIKSNPSLEAPLLTIAFLQKKYNIFN